MSHTFRILLCYSLILLTGLSAYAQDRLSSFSSNGKYGFKDSAGKVVIKPQFDKADSFIDGVAKVKHKDKYGYIDKTGNFIIQPQYEDALSFSEGLARIKQYDKYGYIDKSGNFVIQPQFDDAWSFSEGLASAKQNGKWGYIDKTGNFVIQPQYDDADSFSEGLAPVKQNSMYGYINKTGNFVIPPYFENAISFRGGLAKVKQNNKWVSVDLDGVIYMNEKDAQKAIQTSSWADYLANELGSREDFLKGKGLKAPDEARVKANVQKELESWQKKDEFETTAQWQKRVNDATINAKAQELARRYVDDYNSKLAAAQKEYDAKFATVLDDYKKFITGIFSGLQMTLMPYDADNQTFLIATGKYGDIHLPVPLARAKEFKADWENLRKQAKPEFALSGDKLVLKSVTFGNYVYDANISSAYEQAPMSSNYKPVDLSGLMLDFNATQAAPAAAENMKVKSLDIVPTDLTARTSEHARIDNNGQKCAILKVFSTDKIAKVHGAVIGEPVTMATETWIYMANNVKEVELIFEHHLPLHIRFVDYNYPTLNSQFVYKMVLTEDR